MYDYVEDDADRTVRENERLVYYIIQRHFPTLAQDEDVIQSGRIGLFKAWKHFDPNKGVKFATFATTTIINEILMYIRSTKKARDAFTYCDKRLDQCYSISDEDVAELYDMIEDNSAEYHFSNCELDVEQFIQRCTDREKTILMLLYKNYTQREIADRIGVSQSYVSRLIDGIHKRFLYFIYGDS